MPHLSPAAWTQPSQTAEGDEAAAAEDTDADVEQRECRAEGFEGAARFSKTVADCMESGDPTDFSGGPHRCDSVGIRHSFAKCSTDSKYIRKGRNLDCMTFDDDNLRRGVSVTTVMSCFGLILGSSRGSAHTFSLSRPVHRLGVFISHNWSTKRLPKFLTLAYHFNFLRALALCVVLDLTIGALLGLRIIEAPAAIPASDVLVADGMTGLCTIATSIAFPVILLFGHDLWGRLGCVSPMVFMDKICIHQEDPIMQRKGIEGLSAFLEASDRMLIVYTDTYMQRLWTVYELASMLILRTNAAITVIPTEVVAILLNGWMMILAFLAMNTVVAAIDWDGAVLLPKVLVGLVTLPFTVHMRKWAKTRALIHDRAQKFSIRNSICAVEADRMTVYGNVCILMRTCGYADIFADEDSALDAFDALARQLVPLHLHSSWGRSGLPWRCGFGLSPLFLAVMTDVLCATELQEASPARIISHTSIWLAVALAALPLWAAFAASISGLCIQLEGWMENVFLCIAWITVCAVAVAVHWATTFLWARTWDDPSWVWFVAPGCIALILITLQVYCSRAGTMEEQEAIKAAAREKSGAL